MSTAKDKKFNSQYNRKDKPTKKEFVPVEFVEIRLTKADREELERFAKKLDELILNPLDMLVNVGNYKVSIRYDENNDAILVSITGTQESVNPNICVTTYGADIDECIIMALYKAYDIHKADWIVWGIEDKTSNKRWG